ncbi:DUF3141 domain-containing protein [Methylocystis heyeri]|uniref:DUF3141 domain-containing protein n=2 Tax=Methylocystis heyeri TaxID=391905 RepID=A0A6B8KKD7_9HYPH|nr:DUF3141 domain-containing protein [Methylocystis heyeri]
MYWWSAVGDYYWSYYRDACERSLLYLDVLRRRGEDYREQSAKAAPHVLSFDFVVLVDGRMLPRPVNYGLLRIIPPPEVETDPGKRPFIVFDPRAGHGPGIGGMKHDSEIGVALGAGHPCYFVGFLPQPVAGQTIEDVCRAEAYFVRFVADRHREADGKPALIGNCQAGWQILMMAAMEPELAGPILVAGTPLSYWAGVRGIYPMRYLGGLLGGGWLTWLMGDIGNGIFDGAWLISNFESNNPANTLWKKPYNVYANVDTEAKRFLDFEKWWGNPILLDAGEMRFIVDELFIGNRLAAAKIATHDGERIDLRKVKSPIIVFCSFGDDITPPQQALDWILDLYEDVDAIVANGQTIIYSLHQNIGHLGIFVSARVATKEHAEFVFNIDLVDVMPSGLYEIILTRADGAEANPQLISGDYIAKLEPRTLDDIRALGGNDAADERRFETAARVSEINRELYRAFLQPWVKALVDPAMAEFLRQLHPNRVMFRVFSDSNPLMAPVAKAAETIRGDRHPVEAVNPFLALEKMASTSIVVNLEIFAKAREAVTEAIFLDVYGSPLLQAVVGVGSSQPRAARASRGDIDLEAAHAQALADMTRGGFIEAGMRALLYVLASGGADERQFNALEALRNAVPEAARPPLSKIREIIRRQAELLRADETKAVAAIAEILPEDSGRRAEILSAIYRVVSGDGEPDAGEMEKFREISRLFLGKASPAELHDRQEA